MDDLEYYDKKGRPVRLFDVLSVFHFIAAHRREKRFMYKHVTEIVRQQSGNRLLKCMHLNRAGGYYWQLMDGKIHRDIEIVQGYENAGEELDFRDRPRLQIKCT